MDGNRDYAALTEREYKHLKRRLRHVKAGQIGFLTNATASISKGLNWPVLRRSDQLVLSMLNGPLSRAEKDGAISSDLLDACIEGIDLLLRHAPESDCSDWAVKMRRVSNDVLVPWIHGTDLDIATDWNP